MGAYSMKREHPYQEEDNESYYEEEEEELDQAQNDNFMKASSNFGNQNQNGYKPRYQQ